MMLELRRLWAIYWAVEGVQPDLYFDRDQAEIDATSYQIVPGRVEEVVAVVIDGKRALIVGQLGHALEVRS